MRGGLESAIGPPRLLGRLKSYLPGLGIFGALMDAWQRPIDDIGALARFYSPGPTLFDGSFQLNDIELVK